MRISRIVLFLALFEVNSITPTVFKASGRLSCEVVGPWCYFISYYETDHLFKDDLLDFNGVICTNQRSSVYNLKGFEDGDGVGNNFYEVTIYIAHNCSFVYPGKIRMIQKNPQVHPVEKEEITLEWSLDLTNKGDIVEYYN